MSIHFRHRLSLRNFTGLAIATALALPAIATASEAARPQHASKEHTVVNHSDSIEKLPAAGHTYRVDFGAGNAFEIAFGHDADMTFTKLQDPNKGHVETIHYSHKKLRDGQYLVYWQEADKTTVVHVEDFDNGTIYSNITSPDGQFFNGFSTLEKVK